ncbi:hypothetical protein SteCoe_29028 [Stentor coeruleus]|uniref:PX domain-containing protein n=1 Tax=Stentor coeruleus TaxID=5963 RepID=A0A1R2B6V9_9CILI|nr:hypothetical protein SteCoe_29028 [Stentor coeruleus]
MEIRIPSYREIEHGKKSFIAYQIVVSFREWRNIVEKRYSEFVELHEVMKLIQKIIKKPIPNLPPHKALKSLLSKLSEEDLEERRRDLENYLRALEISPCAKHSKFFPEFVSLPLRFRDDWALGFHEEGN